MGDLEFDGEPTSVVYGVFSELLRLVEEFDTDQFVFAFDAGKGFRRQYNANYKNREGLSEEEKHKRRLVFGQVRALRDRYLRKIGFGNVFFEEGYEGDDIIASVVLYGIRSGDEAVIVSSDQDLWQLIRENVVCYNPTTKRVIDQFTFIAEWGISPPQWADVKAIAGCPGDGVEGIRGVGEKTAAKWIAGRLRPHTKAYKMIDGALDVYNRNIKLVRLPFEGCPYFVPRRRNVNSRSWDAVMESLGMESLVGRWEGGWPIGVRK